MIYLIVGGKSAGKTTKMLELYKQNIGFGFCSKKVFSGDRLIGYDIVSLDGKYNFEFARLKELKTEFKSLSNQRFDFNEEIISDVESLFERNINNYRNFYLDEIGVLELVHNKGFYKVLEKLISLKNKNIYITVNSKSLEIMEKLIEGLDYEIIKLVSTASIIMASGNSVRFGEQNKLLCELNGKSIFETVLDTVLNSDVFSEIIVVTQYREIMEICSKHKNVNVVENLNSSVGISESIKLGVKNTPSYIDGYMFIQADQIYVSKETLRKLCFKFKENENHIIVPVYNNESASPKIFSKKYKDELLLLEGDNGGKDVVKKNISSVIKLNIENDYEIKDIDFEEEFYYENKKNSKA